MKRQYFFVIILFLNVSFLLAQDGSLDATFGAGGKVTTAIGSGDDFCYSVAIQSDGKIVVAGYSYVGKNDFAVVRYNSNGSLDATFGTSGKVTTAIGSSVDEGFSVAIQSDGKIVVAGYSYNGTKQDFAVVRYNSDGSLDGTFGTGGKVTTAIGSGDDWGRSVAIQSDGKIVVAGLSQIGFNDDFTVVRYNSDGSLDGTFGSGGKVTTAVGPGNDYGQSVAIQSDGKIVVAGYSWNSSLTFWDFAVVRYNINGTLDGTFNTTGIVRTAIGSGYSAGFSVAIQSDGKIVVAGYSWVSNNDITVVRYNSNGSLDVTFGSGGIVTTAIWSGDDYANSVAIQSDGKIVVAGYTQDVALSKNNFAVVRYTSTGSLDATFGTNGKDTTAFGSIYDPGFSVAIQSDGKIVVAGYTYNGANNDFAVLRYDNSFVLPVELTTFSAEVVGKNAEINWQTATEMNNYGFEVERRKISNELSVASYWEKIGFVAGNGTSNSPHGYSYSDASLTSGRYAYRLKQIDNSGVYKYSQSVELEVGLAPVTIGLSQNYPNPFNPSTKISFTLTNTEHAKLSVYNLLGQQVEVLFDGLAEGQKEYIVTFDASQFVSGIYLYKMQTPTRTDVRKMILMK